MRRNEVVVADVLDFAAGLDAGSVSMLCTSPPYYGLRSYGVEPTEWPAVAYAPLPGLPPLTIESWCGCLGLEPTIEMYVGHLVAIFRALRPALHASSTLWLNLGDSYNTRSRRREEGNRSTIRALEDGERVGSWSEHAAAGRARYSAQHAASGLKDKDLFGVPWRVAYALQADGWWLRSAITWAKKACMPESAQDRPTQATEMIFLLSNSARYFYDTLAVAERAVRGAAGSTFTEGKTGANGLGRVSQKPREESGTRNLRNWWLVDEDDEFDGPDEAAMWVLGPEPYHGPHYATYPTEIPRRAIRAGSSLRGVCPDCRAPWVRVVEGGNPSKDANVGADMTGGAAITANPQTSAGLHRQAGGVYPSKRTVGWRATCDCGELPVPPLVLDPFAGSGTTLATAAEQGRDWLGCDLDARAVEWSRQRIERIGRPAPKRPRRRSEGQMTLFGDD